MKTDWKALTRGEQFFVIQGRTVCGKPFTPAGRESYTGTEARPPLHEEAGNRRTKKLIKRDATNPKQKAVTDYKEQVDKNTPPPNNRKTNKQENQYNHNGHNNQKTNQRKTTTRNSTCHILDHTILTIV